MRQPRLYPILIARVGRTDDVEAMGQIVYPPGQVSGEKAAIHCARIVGEPFGFSIVVTRQVGRGAPQIVGVQNGALIASWLSEEWLASDERYIHNRIENAARPPFPMEEEVGRANAGEGLDFLLAHLALHPELDPAESIRVRGLMVSTFSEFFAGNRIRRILVETGGEDRRMAIGAGFQIVKPYGDDLCLLGIDLARSLEVQNFQLARLLDYRPPVFGFPPLAREALRLAIQGMTDAQVTARYGISGASLASRWNRIFDIVEEVMPELFEVGKGRRSRDRLPLLAYVRAHPEELWPYSPADGD